MSITTLMNLDLPTPSVTLGPLFAQMINDAMELIDSHDHSTGQGAKIKPNGMNINANLDIQQNQLLNVGALALYAQNAVLSGALNALKVHSYAGDLYYTNNSGSVVQITSGGSIVSSPGLASIFSTVAVSTNLTISPSDTFVQLAVNTTSVRTVTLPLASSVTTGRIYIIKDASGLADTNAITISAAGSDLIDGSASFVNDIKYASHIFISDGVSAWLVN
jgi:hypothetical protein